MLGAVACSLLGQVSTAFFFVSALLLLFGFGIWILESNRNRPDPYDLAELQRIHEVEHYGHPDDEEIAPDADVLCPFCGEEYGAAQLVCPRCRRS